MEEIIIYRDHPSCQLYHWGVDVQEGTAPISRGIIRDWIPRKAVIVDFLYPGHHEVHVPYRSIIGVSCSHRWQYETGDAVETIVQRSSDQPWRWYPSKVLATDSYGGAYDLGNAASYAFVEIDYGDEVGREVMASDRVRLPSGPPFKKCPFCSVPIQILTGIRALGKHLHRHTVALSDEDEPALFAVTKKDGFLRIWERESGMTGAKFEDDRLVYISHSRTPIAEGVMKKLLRRICGLYQELAAAVPLASDSLRLGSLPPELIGEVLSFLDVNDQIECRKVCRAWYPFPQQRLVYIDLAKCEARRYEKLAVTLHKTVTSFTKTLVLAGQDLKRNYDLVQAVHMLKSMGSRMATVILFEVDEMENLSSSWHWDYSAFAQICQKLLWQQTVHGSRCRVFRSKESDGGLQKQWTEVSLRV